MSVSELAKKHNISRKRILQILDEKGLREQCLEKKGTERVSMLLIPSHLFDDYAPDLLRQEAGKTPKSTESLKKKIIKKKTPHMLDN